jgi:rare lipoprotein A
VRHTIAWRLGAIVCGVAGLAACQRRAPVAPLAPAAHYVVGPAWQGAGGAWFYPQEQSAFEATGLAVIDQTSAGTRTADGEIYDPAAVVAAVQTLQLPSVIQVHDLETGRILTVRAIGRGPAEPGRLIALSPAAARLLGMRPGEPARVAIALQSRLSQSAAAALPGAPRVAIAAAPVGAVSEESLGPPGTISTPSAAPAAARQAEIGQATAIPTGPAGPTEIVQGTVMPGALFVDGGRFTVGSSAAEVAARLGAGVTRDGIGRETVYRVLAGPFRSVSEADAALDQARHAGVTGAHIIVE